MIALNRLLSFQVFNHKQERPVIRLILSILILSQLAYAGDSQTFPEAATVGGKKLVLNGIGIRKATIFNVKVYRGALYLEKQNNNADEVVNSSQNKRIQMHFVRDVSGSKIKNGWNEGFEKNTDDLTQIKDRIGEFNNFMEDISDGEEIVLDFNGDSVSVTVKGQAKGTIKGANFLKALLRIWLGPKPPNDDLKKGMLGL